MPRSRRPSFLTKQKEMQRRDKANKKREERRLRKTQPHEATQEVAVAPSDEPEPPAAE